MTPAAWSWSLAVAVVARFCTRPIANLPITRATVTWPLPLAISSGSRDVPSKSRPIGA